MRSSVVLWLGVALLGLLLALLGPRFAPEIFTPGTRTGLHLFTAAVCGVALYLRWRERVK